MWQQLLLLWLLCVSFRYLSLFADTRLSCGSLQNNFNIYANFASRIEMEREAAEEEKEKKRIIGNTSMVKHISSLVRAVLNLFHAVGGKFNTFVLFYLFPQLSLFFFFFCCCCCSHACLTSAPIDHCKALSWQALLDGRVAFQHQQPPRSRIPGKMPARKTCSCRFPIAEQAEREQECRESASILINKNNCK